MFAVILTGGKQYKVEVGTVLNIEKIDAAVGEKVNFNSILVSDNEKVLVGEKENANTIVTAEVLAQDKAAKIVVFKYKAKKNYRRKAGHRQPFTAIKITAIKLAK